MSFIGAAIPAIGAIAGAFGGRKSGRPLGQGDVDEAYNHSYKPFQFNPNANDPALMLQQARLGRMRQQNYGHGVNELNRAGLGGSSIGLNNLQNIDQDYARNIEDAGNQSLMNQRDEQLHLYDNDQAYRQKLQFARLGSLNDARSADASARTNAVGQLAGVAGNIYRQSQNPEGDQSRESPGMFGQYRYIDPSQPWLGGSYG